jgi:Tol biopolymer transport system component/DNA-binding winged helix-turn-helix (wHTH) protein
MAHNGMDEIKGYEFGEFRIDLTQRLLLKHGERVTIRPKIFDLLLLLVEKRGEVVSKETIISRVWPEEVVEDSNLTQSIHYLRRIIDDPSRNESYILTVPTRGYLLATDIRQVTDWEAASLPPARELPVEELSPASDLLAVEPATDLKKWSHGRLLFYGSIGFLVVCGLIWLVTSLIFRSSITNLTILSLTPINGLQLDPEFSPNGKLLAFSSYGEAGKNEDIYLKRTDQAQLIRMTTSPEADRSPVWSPDGKSLAFLRWVSGDRLKARVILTDLDGRGEREVGESRGALGWMPDGRQLIVSDLETSSGDRDGASTVLYLISLDGLERKPLTFSSQTKSVDTMPRVLANGIIVAFLRSYGEAGRDIHILDVPSGKITQITSDRRMISCFRWGLRASGFYFVSDRGGEARLWHITIKGMVPEIFEENGIPRLVDQIPYEFDQFAISPDGRQLVYSKYLKDNQTQILDISTSGEKRDEWGCLIASAKTDESPQFSPDGKQVAYVSHRSGWDEIWLARQDCGQPIQLTNLRGPQIGHLRWSPNGGKFVFARMVDGQFEIFTIRVDGTDLQRLTINDYADVDPSWSRDGMWIYFESLSTPQGVINRIPSNGGDSVAIIANGGRNPVESVDGARLYFTRAGILWSKYLRSVENGQGPEMVVEQLSGLSVDQYWHIAPGSVYFVAANTGPMMAIDRLDLASGRIERVAEINGFRSSDSGGIGVSSDDRYLAINFNYGAISDMTIVEGWRRGPFSQYLIEKLHIEKLMYPKML